MFQLGDDRAELRRRRRGLVVAAAANNGEHQPQQQQQQQQQHAPQQRQERLAQQRDYLERFRAAQQQRQQAQLQLGTEAIPDIAGGGATRNHQHQQRQRSSSFGIRWYGLFSVLLAIFAIVVPPLNIGVSMDIVVRSTSEKAYELAAGDWLRSMSSGKDHGSESHHHAMNHLKHSQQSNNNKVPHWLRWIFPDHDDNEELFKTTPLTSLDSVIDYARSYMDPTILNPSATTITDLLDKILTSTPRLIVITNLLLACTYYTHTAVADWFLQSRASIGVAGPHGMAQVHGHNAAGTPADSSFSNSSSPQRGLGGYLLFKILLMSAVVAPDILDLLILLSWYTLLAFLRSLAHQCHAATLQQQQQLQDDLTISNSGNTTTSMFRRGILQLLMAILVSDVLAASLCVALFHGAGWGMVLLLTCDNALLLLDVMGYILVFVAQVWEQQHLIKVQEFEATMYRLNRQQQQQQLHSQSNRQLNETSSNMYSSMRGVASIRESLHENDDASDDDDFEDLVPPPNQNDAEAEGRALERRLEIMEQVHAKRLSILDSTVFVLQLVAHLLTIVHFLHIWMLHGVQFTLIDGVLALHLYSAIAQASRKIADRRKLHRIARELDDRFDDATEMELRKAAAAGDVCCICLASMNSTTQVKKVGCGHLYHTNCLREVVDRARSLETARCPLCRAHVIDGQQPEVVPNRTGTQTRQQAETAAAANHEQGPEDAARQQAIVAANPAGPRDNERALFRFSTEALIPAWLPIPAFSFEVVRRQIREPVDATATNNVAQREEVVAPQDEPRLSILRRLLILAGAIPMSVEEEAAALEQLVDMFPQYDRSDLARELRTRRSAEGVAEQILAGTFQGVARGRE